MTRAPTVLVAVDPLMYRQVIAHSLRQHRPCAEVRVVELEDLDGEARRLAPDLVVCNRATAAVRASALSWVELDVRFGAETLDANVKVDSHPCVRVRQAKICDVLAALDATETLQKA